LGVIGLAVSTSSPSIVTLVRWLHPIRGLFLRRELVIPIALRALRSAAEQKAQAIVQLVRPV
jgi:hypothetical protein